MLFTFTNKCENRWTIVDTQWSIHTSSMSMLTNLKTAFIGESTPEISFMIPIIQENTSRALPSLELSAQPIKKFWDPLRWWKRIIHSCLFQEKAIVVVLWSHWNGVFRLQSSPSPIRSLVQRSIKRFFWKSRFALLWSGSIGNSKSTLLISWTSVELILLASSSSMRSNRAKANSWVMKVIDWTGTVVASIDPSEEDFDFAVVSRTADRSLRHWIGQKNLRINEPSTIIANWTRKTQNPIAQNPARQEQSHIPCQQKQKPMFASKRFLLRRSRLCCNI